MPRYAAFLRGINLGNRRLTNAELEEHVAAAGVDDVGVFLSSGNVAFDHPDEDTAALEAHLERHFQDALGYAVDTFVRRVDALPDIADVAEADAAADDGFKAHVIFLKEAADADVETRFTDLETGDDRFLVRGREVVWLRRGGMARAPISPADIERALGGGTSTMRTLNTVRRMAKKFG